MLLVAFTEHDAWIEVGYGLEPILPDALAGRVVDEQLFPAFKQQRYGQGMILAVNRIAEIIERGEPARGRLQAAQPKNELTLVLMFLVFSVFVSIGFATMGAGVAKQKPFPTFGGLGLGGVPLFVAFLVSGWVFFLLVVLAATFFLGSWGGWQPVGPMRRGQRAAGWDWTWIWPGSGWGGGGFGGSGFGGFGGGGFGGGFGGGGGGGFGGFGGGCSGGGGAGGRW